jgi:hypothetical protein
MSKQNSGRLETGLVSATTLLVVASLAAACSMMAERENPSALYTSQPTDTLTPDLTGTVGVQQTQTAAPVATMFARLDSTAQARATTLALTPTTEPTPTPTPPSWCTTALEVLAREPESITETLTSQMLQVYAAKHSVERLCVIACGESEENHFDIEVVSDTIDPTWNHSTGITDSTESFHAFFSWPPEHDWEKIPEESRIEEWTKWNMSTKMLIEVLDTNDVYWVKWTNYIPWRPINLEGWTLEDVLVFSQFGNPWHGFLTAIDAGEGRFLCTMGLEYW